MQIIWQNGNLKAQYAFRHRAGWSGLTVHHTQIPPGRMLEHEINVSISGKLTTERISSTGRRKMFSGNGGLCITSAGQTIAAFWEKSIDRLGIFLAPDLVEKTAVENRFSPKFDLYDDRTDKNLLIQYIGLTLLDEYNNKTVEGRLYAESLIQTLTLHLLKNYSNAKSISENLNGGLSGYKLRRVTEFINENLEEDLSLAEIAEVACLSRFHFARAFRKSTGLTPQNYLMQ